MLLQSNIVTQISAIVEKMPETEQKALLKSLKADVRKKEIPLKHKKVSQKDIMKLSAEIKKGVFEKYTKKRLDALNIRY